MYNNKPQENLLKRYRSKYGKFRVAINTGQYWIHLDYPSKEAKYWINKERTYDDGQGLTDRQILKDEIVMESDMNMRKMNRAVAETMEKRMIRHNYNFERWFSGNKSYHVHTYFPELMLINNNYDLKLIKELFIKWLYCDNGVECSLGNTDDKGCYIVRHKVDMQLTGKVLIRLENARHPFTDVRKHLVSEHETDEDNKLPREVWEAFSRNKNTYRPHKRRRNALDMPCIRYFYTNAIPDCRKRVTFVLFNNLKLQFGLASAEIMIREWNKNINSSYIDERQLMAIINSGKRNSSQAPSHPYIYKLMAELERLDVCRICKEVN